MRWFSQILGLILAIHPALAGAAPTSRGTAKTTSFSTQIAPIQFGQNGGTSLDPVTANLALGGVLPTLDPISLPDGMVEKRGLIPKSPDSLPLLQEEIRRSGGKQDSLPVEKILADNDVLLMGESHTSASSVKTVTDNLERMKEAGVSIVGIEGLKTFNQKSLDNFFDGNESPVPMDALSFSPERTEEFKGLLEEAKRVGVRVVALGRPLDQWGRRVQGLAAARTGRAPLSFNSDLKAQVQDADERYEKGFNESVAQVALQERNADMSSILAEKLPKGAKAVVLVGAGHIEHPDELEFRLFGLPVSRYGTLAGALKDDMLSAFSVTLTGGLFTTVEASDDQRSILRPVFSLLESAINAGRRAFLPTSEKTGVFHMGGSVSNSVDLNSGIPVRIQRSGAPDS